VHLDPFGEFGLRTTAGDELVLQLGERALVERIELLVGEEPFPRTCGGRRRRTRATTDLLGTPWLWVVGVRAVVCRSSTEIGVGARRAH